jgi:dipeptide/tripeptide permease
VAKVAQKLAKENIYLLQHYQEETTMETIINNPKTSVAGVISALSIFAMAVPHFLSGDIGNGILYGIAGVGVLLGFLNASDAKNLAQTIGSAIPKPAPKQQLPQ